MPNWIGDAVMATPTLRALRRHAGPDAEIVGIAQRPIAELLAGTPWLDALWLRDDTNAAPKLDWRSFASRLRAAKVDLTIHLTNDFGSALAARLGGVRERAGYVRNGRGWLLTRPLVVPSRGGKRTPVSTLDYYLSIAYAAGCAPESPAMELATTADEEALADRAWVALGLAPDARPVVLNSTGRFGPSKLWPERHCAALAARIVRELDLAVVVLAGPGEAERAARIASAAGNPRVASLAVPPPSIGLSKACVKRARCMISTDSGPRHLAAAFGVPVVALFGPTDVAWTDTHYAAEIRLAHDVDCRPCARRECPLGHHACMELLHVDTVFAAVERAIGRPAQVPLAFARPAPAGAVAGVED
jgi:heptosyltransferase-2